jgi:hypothetical protein
MICPYCQQDMPDDSNYCDRCSRAVYSPPQSPENVARIRFRSSNFIPDNTDKTAFGGYAIELTPSSDNSEGMLTFAVEQPNFPKDMFFNRIKLEANYFLSFLSLTSLSNCEFQAGLWNLENIVPQQWKYTLKRKPFNFEEVTEHYYKLCGLTNEERKRFVDACRRYRQAVSIYEKEPVVSFFLLVVAIECLSNSMVLQERDVVWDAYQSFYANTEFRKITNSVKFVEFVCRYLPSGRLQAEGNLDLLKKRLLSAYFIRNAFVHDGEDMPPFVNLADTLGMRSIAYATKWRGRDLEVRAPAMLWLESIVVNALLGYLGTESREAVTAMVFRQLAEEAGKYNVKLRQPHPEIQKDQIMTLNFAKEFFEGDE